MGDYNSKVIRKYQDFPRCSDGRVSFGRAIRLGQTGRVATDYRDITGEEHLKALTECKVGSLRP